MEKNQSKKHFQVLTYKSYYNKEVIINLDGEVIY
jgi:hypothetical protein